MYNLFHLSVHSFLLQWRNFLRAEVKSGVIHFKSVESGFPVINEKLAELGKVHQSRKTGEQEKESKRAEDCMQFLLSALVLLVGNLSDRFMG